MVTVSRLWLLVSPCGRAWQPRRWSPEGWQFESDVPREGGKRPWWFPQRPDCPGLATRSSSAFLLGLPIPHAGAESLPPGLSPPLLFPQIYEVVRPLVSLLHLQRTGLENFEGLMALTNLAGISERLR